MWKNWYHFYGNDTNNYVSKDELIKICKKNNVRSSEDYIKLCETHEELPKEPAEYYRDFTNLKNELGLFNRRKWEKYIIYNIYTELVNNNLYFTYDFQ